MEVPVPDEAARGVVADLAGPGVDPGCLGDLARPARGLPRLRGAAACSDQPWASLLAWSRVARATVSAIAASMV